MPTRPVSGVRSPLFRALRRAVRLSATSSLPGSPPVDELIGMNHDARALRRAERRARMDRRSFLKAAGIGTAGLVIAPTLSGCRTMRTDGGAPRIVIVGGGMAGLNTAYKLKQAGLASTIYESSKRTGGRMYSTTGLFHPGQTTEIGGEFIDTIHTDVLALVNEFGLDMLDMDDETLNSSFFFNGQHYSEEDIVATFRPVAAKIAADYDTTADVVDFRNEGGGSVFDRMSLDQYFDRIGADGLIRQLLEVAYVTEYGLEADEQSALNLLFLIGTDLSEGFSIFGESDERYKVVGGNQRVVDELAKRLQNQIELESRLVAVRPNGQGYRLSFESGASTRDVDADIVVLTLPFTTLRQVDLASLALPESKTNAIQNLGYGMNAKVFASMNARPWRAQGYGGDSFSDEGYQLVWDNAQLQPGETASLTFYSGGDAGIRVGEGSADDQVRRLMPGAERTFPGSAAAFAGKASRFHWPTHPHTLGSYACYRPGQWTTIAGAEIEPVGNLFFAGEHCSYDFQGFMNGAAETGRRAAESVMATAGVRAVIG
ncbi:MAG: NAD(P)/FAD-dependent oxidoreductase [Rhodothermales bacterium]